MSLTNTIDHSISLHTFYSGKVTKRFLGFSKWAVFAFLKISNNLEATKCKKKLSLDFFKTFQVSQKIPIKQNCHLIT